MINKTVEERLLENSDCFLIPDDKVVHVMDEHSIDHAILVLTQARYSKIVVLDREGKIAGLLALSDIVNKMFDLTGIDPSNLEGLKVKDLMSTDVPVITDPFDVEVILNKLVDQAFLVVVDEYNVFTGIVTRREVLKSVNHLVHTINHVE